MRPTAAPSLSPRALELGTEGAFAVLARARELERAGRDVVHLEIGEPDFPTPAHAAEAAFAAIRAGETGYCPAPGIAELREAAAAELARTRGVPVGPGRVLVANGAKPFLFFGVLATCEPGDEVIYPDPGFPIYESAIRFAGATPVPLVLRETDDFAFSIDELAARVTDADEARDPQLAAEPDRRRARPRDARGGRGRPARQPGLGPLRRGLRPAAPRGRVRLDRDRAGDARAHDRPRQLLEDLRDDRLALRLRGGARAAGRAPHALPRQRDVVRAAVRAARRGRRAHRPAGRRRADAGRVPRAARPRRRRPRALPGRHLPRPARRVLRVPERDRRCRSAPTPSPTACSTRRASRCSAGPRSAPRARATCASRTPPRASAWPRGSRACAPSSSACRPAKRGA